MCLISWFYSNISLFLNEKERDGASRGYCKLSLLSFIMILINGNGI